MQSNGGVMSAEAARARPLQTLLSGPVGGTSGGAGLARALGRPNLLCVDMGGTSFDVSLIVDGAPTVSNETELEGLPVLTPLVDIHTIGAGGGSYAWLEAGALRVGPHSAGADPGPVCYGRGGTQVTVTDANLFLGRLDPAYFLGGQMALDAPAAAEAVHTLATSLGLDDVTLSEGIVSIINAKMADAIRTITVKQGIDPRDYALVAFGGAGPMHAVWLARELEIEEVIIPWSPGTFSAWGMLQTDIRHDVSQAFYRSLAGLEISSLRHAYEALETQGHAALAEEGVAPEARSFRRAADMRYIGQEYSVTVPVDAELDAPAIDRRFHDTYRARYGHATPGAPVEFVNLRLAAIGALPRHPAQPLTAGDSGAATVAERTVVFDGVPHRTTVLLRDRLQPGARFSGPLIIEEATATIVIPPGYAVSVDETGSLLVHRERDQHGR
jgi:N-methylhydantoinase A